MKISKTMAKYYLSYITVAWFGDHPEPPETVEEYGPLVRNIKALAEPAGDLPWLRLALEELLTNPTSNLKEFDGGHYPYSSDQIQDLLHYVWKTLWPGSRLPRTGDGPVVELVSMSAEEWIEHRKLMTGG
jgi:hypothetical protein